MVAFLDSVSVAVIVQEALSLQDKDIIGQVVPAVCSTRVFLLGLPPYLKEGKEFHKCYHF